MGIVGMKAGEERESARRRLRLRRLAAGAECTEAYNGTGEPPGVFPSRGERRRHRRISGRYSSPVTELQVRCATCGADILLPENLRTADCPYCGSSSVVDRPPSVDRPLPTFALGFVIDQARAQSIARQWAKSRGPFSHGGIRRAVADRTLGVYVPAWLYGARAGAQWSARIGEDYTVTETYVTTDAKGRPVTRTRTRTETEWRPLSGLWDAYIIDVVVTASKGIDNDALESIEPFDLRALRRYRPEFLSGWTAEEATLSRAQCLAQAREESQAEVYERVKAFLPGDRQRDLRCEVSLEDEVADLVLLPVWVFTLRYAEGKPPLRLLINGQTGRAVGHVPLSAPRIAFALLLGLGLIAFLLLAFGVGDLW